MKRATQLPFLLTLLPALLLSGCNNESLESEYTNDQCEALLDLQADFEIPYEPYEGTSTGPITEEDSSELPTAITFTDARLVNTDIPIPGAPSGGTLSVPATVTVTDNSVNQIRIEPSDLPTGFEISAVFVQFEGTNQHFLIPIDPDAAENQAATAEQRANNGQISEAEAQSTRAFADAGGVYINIEGPVTSSGESAIQADEAGTVVANPEITIAAFLIPEGGERPDYSQDTWTGIDDPTLWTATTTMTVEAVAVGAGQFQVTLTWDTGTNDPDATSSDSDAVDIDLYVTEPGGETIFYGNSESDNGGELDTDDLLGFGPENVRYQDEPPEGDYIIGVEYFDAGEPDLIPTNYSVNVIACNQNRTYTGLLNEKSVRRQVVSFTLEDGCTLPEAFSIQEADPPEPSGWEQTVLCNDNRSQ